MNAARAKKILEIAKANALEGLDQGRVEGYGDNLLDMLVEEFPDCTQQEAAMAEIEFNRIAKSRA